MDEVAQADLRADLRATARRWTLDDEPEARGRALAAAADVFRWLHASASTEQQRSSADADLRVALQLLYEQSGQLDVLNEVIDRGEIAVETAVPGPWRAREAANLANALRLRFEATGRAVDLESAVRNARLGLDPAVPEPLQAQRESNLALILRIRHELLGRAADLEQAIAGFRQALRLAGRSEPQHGRICSNLSVALRIKGVADGDRNLLDEAVEFALEPLGTPIGYQVDRPGLLNNAGLACIESFRAGRDREHLDRALALLKEAAEITAPDREDHRIALLTLAFAHRVSSGVGPVSTAQLDAAVAASLAGGRTFAQGGPDEPLYWSGLGRAYWVRFQHSGNRRDAAAAIAARLSAAGALFGSPSQRAVSGRMAGRWALSVGDNASAAKGYRLAIERLREAAWPGLERSEREQRIAGFDGLAGDATAAALAAGQPEEAVHSAEDGRNVLWDDRLRRTDLAKVADVAPQFADRLMLVREQLDVLNKMAATTISEEVE